MRQPISVAICTMNRADSLPDAVVSVLREDPDELVVVDQSTDWRTRDYILSLGDSRIRYVHSEIAGLSRAYNTAMHNAAARGDCRISPAPASKVALRERRALLEIPCMPAMRELGSCPSHFGHPPRQ